MIVYSWFTYYKWFFYSYVKLPGGVYIYILVVWNMCILFPYIGNSDPNWLSSFQRGRYTTNQIYIYICAFFTSSILMGSSVNKWYSINYIYCWFFSDFGGYETIGGNCFFFGIWICCCHPGFTLCILQRGQLTPSIQLICCMGIYIYRLYIYIYIYMYMKIAYTIVSHGFYHWF